MCSLEVDGRDGPAGMGEAAGALTVARRRGGLAVLRLLGGVRRNAVRRRRLLLLRLGLAADGSVEPHLELVVVDEGPVLERVGGGELAVDVRANLRGCRWRSGTDVT